MKKGQRQLLKALIVFAAIVGVIAYLNWLTSPREFRGILVYKPGMIGIPEDPPPLAYLATDTGTHELDFPRDRRGPALLNDPEHMNGKPVIVRGKWTIRRTLMRKHRAIRVDDLRVQQ